MDYQSQLCLMKNPDVYQVIQKIYDSSSSSNFSGFDPFDGLNSSYIYPLVRWNKTLRLALLQFNKLSPINFRILLGNKPGVNPKSLALFLSGVSYNKSIFPKDSINKLVDLINEHSVNYGEGLGWGYNFDWQNRAFFIPKNTPTVVNTSFIIHALIDAYEVTENPICLDIVKRTIPFYTKDLNIDYSEKGACFSYTPIDKTKVHNANLLAAGALARLSKYFESNNIRMLVNDCVKYGLNGQSSEGSWIYGSHISQNWVDSFHTGFNLEALTHVAKSNIYSNKSLLIDRIELGHKYYLDNFFGKSGEPHYFNNKKYPYDIHTSAQAMSYLSMTSDRKSNEILKKVAGWTYKNMFNNKYFFYRKNKYFTNKINYLRWSQAWMFYGLSKAVKSNKL